MSRIKYPDQKVIQLEIQNIIDNSGVFEESLKEDNYVSFQTIKNNIHMVHIVLSLGAVAALLTLVIIGVVNSRMVSSNNVTPLTSVTDSDDSMVKTVNVNDRVEVSLETFTKNLGGDKITHNYVIPVVSYQGEEVSQIGEFYINKMERLEEDNLAQYRSSVYSTTAQDEDSSDRSVTFENSISVSTGISTKNKNVVSFYENYSLSTNTGASNTIEKYIYGNNFDVSTGERILLSDILEDYSSGIEEMEDYLNQELEEIYASEQSDKVTVRDVSVTTMLKDGNWYFSEDGIVVCCNKMYTMNSEYNGIMYSNVSSTTFVIPYSEIPSLKSEYKN